LILFAVLLAVLPACSYFEDSRRLNFKPFAEYTITLAADIEYGQRSSTVCYLVNIVRDVGRVGETLRWDPKIERFTNCDEGNELLSRPRRKGYELPALT
jgi:hypothetical protein